MSEIEVPLEKVQEDIQEAAHAGDKRTGRAAVTSALLAVIAAISALLAGHYANEAMIEQINAANAWNYYQAKGIKLAIAELKAGQGVEPKASQNVEPKASQNVEPKASQGVEPKASQNVEPKASQNVEPKASQGVEPKASQNVEPKASQNTVELAEKKIEQYHHDQEHIRAEAEEKQAAAARNLARHQYFAAAVTFFQIGIALIAIAILTKRSRYQLFSWALAAGGVVFLVIGLLR